MKKKTICSFLIFSLLLQSACTTLETVQKDEIDNSIIEENIIVTLKDSTEYIFRNNDFVLLEDTIYQYEKYGWEIEDPIKIPFEDISEIKIEKVDGATTALIFIGCLVIGFFVFVSTVTLEPDFSGTLKK